MWPVESLQGIINCDINLDICDTKTISFFEAILVKLASWYFPHIDAFWRLCSRLLFENSDKRRNWSKQAISPFATMFSTFFHRLSIFYYLTKYVESHLLQNCCMRERVKHFNIVYITSIQLYLRPGRTNIQIAFGWGYKLAIVYLQTYFDASVDEFSRRQRKKLINLTNFFFC